QVGPPPPFLCYSWRERGGGRERDGGREEEEEGGRGRGRTTDRSRQADWQSACRSQDSPISLRYQMPLSSQIRPDHISCHRGNANGCLVRGGGRRRKKKREPTALPIPVTRALCVRVSICHALVLPDGSYVPFPCRALPPHCLRPPPPRARFDPRPVDRGHACVGIGTHDLLLLLPPPPRRLPPLPPITLDTRLLLFLIVFLG
ncbi:hypothetical protein GGS23DRAFT_569379, partial [Durotheca rogersii]|uniref:uncharacterized protein n=1 Tax=Durotheca rogersii TaxID=419775 RepID=UPI00221F1EE3